MHPPLTSGLSRQPWSVPGVAVAGRWLFLGAVLLMVTGDGPATTLRVASWPTPAPVLAWAWLYLLVMVVSVVAIAAGGGFRSFVPAGMRSLSTPLVLLLSTFLLSAAFSQVRALSAMAFLTILGIVAFCWVVALLLEDDRLVAMLWPVLAIAILLLAVRVIIWRLDEGVNVMALHVLNNTWVGKLQLAWVFNLFAPLLLARYLGERSRGLATLHAIAWASAGAATYLLFSRIGSVVFALTTLGVCLANFAYWRKWIVIMVVGLGLGLLLFDQSVKMSRYIVTTLVEVDRNPGVAMRLGIWRDAVRMFTDHPIVGIGIGTYDDVAYAVPGSTAVRDFYRHGWHAHNVYLHVLVEAGILGLLAWGYFWYTIVARLARAWRRADPRGRVVATGALAAVLAFLTLSLTEVLIGARVEASLRMNLTLGLVVVLGLRMTTVDQRT